MSGPERVAADALARLLNLSSPADVLALARAGMPTEAGGQYNAQRCIIWYVRHLQSEIASLSSDDREVSRDFLAAVLGVDVRSIKNYVDDGMPKVGRGRFHLRGCIQWYAERLRLATAGSSDLDAARQRKTLAEAEMAEIDLAERRNEVIPLDVHESRLEAIAGRLAAQCKGLDRFIAPVQRATTSVEAKGVLDDVSDALLASLRAVADDLDTIEAPDVERSA